MTLTSCLILAAAVMAIGLYGLVTRKQAVAMLLSVELMANAANMVFAAYGHFRGGPSAQVFVLFALAITVAEVAVGLALVMLLYRRHGDTTVDLASEARQ
ncbi:MAG: NADH-quinone oxidoreductase subunit NuoK [Archangiaceae bacterium]|nr:NADH-quinone oxidoreductase subunit NuoK [Archangiaceae bacterium]